MILARQRNRAAWDERALRLEAHARPANEHDFRSPSPIIDPCGWLGPDLAGKRILCLAAGGGRHGVLFADAGAIVTVVDLSPAMLALDERLARERGLTVRLLEASMDDLSALAGCQFDIVIQPVSTCYVPEVVRVYREVAKVCAPGGLYISQHKQPSSLQTAALPSGHGYLLQEQYHGSGPLPSSAPAGWNREQGTVEFLHSWEALLGGLCRSGFVIEDLLEPRHADPQASPGTFGHHSLFTPPFVTVKARRIGMDPNPARTLWVP